MWLAAVHGRHSGWVRNVEAHRAVRVRWRGTWRNAVAEVHPATPDVMRRFNSYARSGPSVLGSDPALVFVRWADFP